MKLKVTYKDVTRKDTIHECDRYAKSANNLYFYTSSSCPAVNWIPLSEIEKWEVIPEEPDAEIKRVRVHFKSSSFVGKCSITYVCKKVCPNGGRLGIVRVGDEYPSINLAMDEMSSWEILEDDPILSVIEQYLQDYHGNLTGFYMAKASGSGLGAAFVHNLSPLDVYILREAKKYDRVRGADRAVNEPFLNGITKFLKEERSKIPTDHPLWKIK